MPRVYSEDMFDDVTKERLEDEDFYPFEVPPDAFQYLPPPQFGGPSGVVRVAVDPEYAGRAGIKIGPGILNLFRRRKFVTNEEWQRKVDIGAAALATEMVKLGAVKAVIRYDGGNDEGFAWFEHCIMQDGSSCSADELARDLEAAGYVRPADFYTGGSLREFLEDVIGETWSWRLLGTGWGTGPFVLFGAFSVDLKTGVVTDDPNPAPVVRNIRFGAG